MNDAKIIFDSVKKLDEWLSTNKWSAYDPFDGLNAKFSDLLTFNNHYLRIALQQGVRRFPVNLRPLFGIKKSTGSKGMGFCALGYLKLYQASDSDEYLEKAKFCLDWLINNFCENYSGYSWGNHFSYESRGGRLPLGVPTIVWTSLIANVFLDAYEYFSDEKYFEIAKKSGEFVVNEIGRYYDPDGDICFMYTPQNKNNPTFDGCIHNSNVLGAWLLARLYQHTKEEKFLSLASKSVAYTLKHQLPEGGWYYGEPNKFRWIDSFHTGYVLEAVNGYIKATGDKSKEDKLVKGYRYFIKTFFKRDGTPKYYNFKTYPIDIQCASQSIQTLANLSEHDETSIELSRKVALWTIRHLQDKDGFFYFRKYPLITNKTPMFHWGQATMLSALSSILM